MRLTRCDNHVNGGLELVGDDPIVRGVEDFESFYRREYRSVLGLAIVMTGKRQLAEELTQEAFLTTFRQWDRVGAFDSPEAWVRRVVANRSVSAFRRAASEARALLRLGGPRRGGSYPDREGSSPDIDAGVDVWREVRRLPKRQAQVVALTYVEDLPRREVARILQCGEETVKTHLDRARFALSERLVDRLGEGSDER